MADTLGTLGGQIDEIINPSASGVASSSSYKAASSNNYFEGPTAARNRGNMIMVVNSDSNDPVTKKPSFGNSLFISSLRTYDLTTASSDTILHSLGISSIK